MKTSITKKCIKFNQLFYFLGIVLILIIWEIASIIYNNDIIIPSIFDTVKSFFKLLITGFTYKVVGYTLFRLIVVIIISFLSSMILAILSYWKKWIKNLVAPFILILKTLPVASIIIILLVFIGHQRSPYYITFFVIFPIMYEAILQGLLSINQEVIDEIKMQSNLNFIVIKKVYLSMIISNITTSLLQSFGLGLKVMVMAEFISQPNYSIGKELLDQKNNLEYSLVFAWTLILIIIVIVFELLLNHFKEKSSI